MCTTKWLWIVAAEAGATTNGIEWLPGTSVSEWHIFAYPFSHNRVQTVEQHSEAQKKKKKKKQIQITEIKKYNGRKYMDRSESGSTWLSIKYVLLPFFFLLLTVVLFLLYTIFVFVILFMVMVMTKKLLLYRRVELCPVLHVSFSVGRLTFILPWLKDMKRLFV